MGRRERVFAKRTLRVLDTSDTRFTHYMAARADTHGNEPGRVVPVETYGTDQHPATFQEILGDRLP